MGISVSKENVRKQLFDFLSIAGLLFLCIVYIFASKRFGDSLTGDYGDGAYSVLTHTFRSFAERKLSLWLPNLWGGLPAVGNTLVQNLNPLHWLAVLLNGNNVDFFALGIAECLHIYVLAIGLFLFLRITKFSRLISFITVIVLLFSAEMLKQEHWIYIFTGFAWFPLIIDALLMLKERRQWRYVVAGGICIGVSGLANQAQSLLINILIVFCFFWALIFEKKTNRHEIIFLTKQFIVLGAIGFSICAPALLPSIEYTHNAVRFIPYEGFLSSDKKMSLQNFNRYAVAVESLSGFIQYPFQSSSGYWNIGAFPFLGSLFISIGIFVKKQDLYVKRLCTGIAIFSVLYSVGFLLPILFYYVPYFNAIREPFLYLPYLILPFAYFFAVGMKFVFSANSKEIQSGVHKPALLICLLLLIFLSCFLPHNLRIPFQKYNIIIAFLCASTIGAHFLIKRGLFVGGGWYALLFMTVLAQMGMNFRAMQFNRSIVPVAKTEKNVEDLVRRIDSVKLSKEHTSRHMLWSSEGQLYPSNIMVNIGGLDSFAYFNPIPRWNYISRSLNFKIQAALKNTEFWHTNIDPESIQYKQMEESGFASLGIEHGYCDLGDSRRQSSVVTWQAKTLGNGWFVYNTESVADSSSLTNDVIISSLNSREDYDKFAFVNGCNDFVNLAETCANAVTLKKYNSDCLAFNVFTETEGIFVTAETWYPGWSVYIDGKKSSVLQVNYILRGVKCPAGEHIIEFKFMPVSFVVGCILFLVCMASIVVLFLCKCFALWKHGQHPAVFVKIILEIALLLAVFCIGKTFALSSSIRGVVKGAISFAEKSFNSLF